MKRIPLLLLALIVTACGALGPASQPTAPPPPTTVATVLVTVVVTQPAPPTPIPSIPPLPSPTLEAPTAAATVAPPPPATSTPQSVTSGLFTNITRSTDAFYLRCAPTEITFSVTSTSPYITTVELYYRMEDKQSVFISAWKNAGVMETEDSVTYTVTLEALDIHPDLRFVQGWFDYQFVGINKLGQVVSRTERFVQEVSFARDCP